MSITTARLLLRNLEDSDVAFISDLRSNEEVNAWLDRPKIFSHEESRDFIKKINKNCEEGKSYYWGISLKDSPGLIGTICIWNISEDCSSAELGYELHPNFQGKGFMNEAIGGVIDYCLKETGFHLLCAYTHTENEPSFRLLEKHGFKMVMKKKTGEAEEFFYKLELK